MGLTGAICLVFAGCSLLLMDVRRGFYSRLGQLLDLLVAAISFSALWGFLFRYRPLYAFSSDIWIALPAAIGLFVLSVGVLLARPSRGWMRIFSGEAPGSMLLRRLVPASIIIPVVWARFWLYGQRVGLYGTEVGEILFATTMTVGLILVLYFTVKPLNQADAQRKGAEAEILELNAEAKYRGLLEAAPDAMVVVNQGGEIVLLNLQAEKQFGYRRDELVGQKVKNIIPEGFAERLIADGTRTAAEALAQQIGTRIELIGRRKDGSGFPIEIMLSPLESTEGTLVTAAIRDLTDHKRAGEKLARQAKELARSNADLQQFAYVASHDLQEPLRMVASYTQLLAQRYKGRLDSDADEFIAYAVDGAHRMQRLIGDLLAYCRVGTVGMELRETSSGAALEQALLNLQDAIEKSGGVVTHDALPTVIADGAQLVQLFQNVVANAIKYRSAELPRVHVSAKKNGGHEWIFSLQDNGLGIDPKYFEKIFVMFQRLHDREESSGTGIGLTVCKKIAERHGGRMWVESEPGKGSTFYFALPERG